MLSFQFLYHGLPDYWSGDGERWEDNKGCLFAHCHPEMTAAELIDQWVDDFNNGGDCESMDDDISDNDVRHAIMDVLTDKGRDDVANGALSEFACDPCEDCEDDCECYHDSPVVIGLLTDHRAIDIETVRKFLATTTQWVEDYASSDDYGDEYAYLMNESQQPRYAIERYLRGDHYPQYIPATTWLTWNNLPLDLQDHIVNECIDQSEAIYQSNGYACGPDISLESFPIDEHEEQIELSRLVESCDLASYDPAYIAELLSECDRDYCLRNITADDLQRNHACFYMYTYLQTRWDYIIRPRELSRIMAESICQHLRDTGETYDCPVCNGTGHRNNGPTHPTTCWRCNGAGKLMPNTTGCKYRYKWAWRTRGPIRLPDGYYPRKIVN